jgi:DNA polymerase alpha subunit A
MIHSQLLQVQDPDVLISHNLYGFELDVILSRANTLKLATWSKIGRLRRTHNHNKGYFQKDGVAVGRVLCDTYLAAKEFLRETSYSLTHIAQSQLKTERMQVSTHLVS